jgi:hypothetical protein
MVRGSRRNDGRPDQERSLCGEKLPSRRALTRGSLPPALGIHRQPTWRLTPTGATTADGSVTELSANQIVIGPDHPFLEQDRGRPNPRRAKPQRWRTRRNPGREWPAEDRWLS